MRCSPKPCVRCAWVVFVLQAGFFTSCPAAGASCCPSRAGTAGHATNTRPPWPAIAGSARGATTLPVQSAARASTGTTTTRFTCIDLTASCTCPRGGRTDGGNVCLGLSVVCNRHHAWSTDGKEGWQFSIYAVLFCPVLHVIVHLVWKRKDGLGRLSVRSVLSILCTRAIRRAAAKGKDDW